MQNQLHQIFDEQLIIKRVNKQLTYFIASDDLKTLIDWRFSFIRKQQLIIHFTLKQKYLKKCKLYDKIKSNVQLKIIYPRIYPYVLPKIYIVSDNLNQMYTVNTRDYFRYYFPDWTTKNQLSDILFNFPQFYQNLQNQKNLHMIGQYHQNQFIEMQPLYNQRCSQFYPIQISINQRIQHAFLIINRFQIIFLDTIPIQNYLRIAHVFPLQSVKNIFRSKRIQKKIVILIKWISIQGGFQFFADDHQNIIQSIITKKKTAPKLEQPTILNSQQQKQQGIFQQKQVKRNKNLSMSFLEEINQSIIIYESLLEKQFSQKNIDALIQLYKQAIEFCSQTNSQTYMIYLNKLQDFLSKQEVQVLLNSNVPQKKVQQSIFQKYDFQKINEQQYQKKSDVEKLQKVFANTKPITENDFFEIQ